MKNVLWVILVLFFCFGCEKDDAKPSGTDNSVDVYIDGNLYFTQEDNMFNAINRKIESDGTEYFTFLLFATGERDEAEDLTVLVDVTNLSGSAELRPGVNSISFTQIDNDCSGTLFPGPDDFTANISTSGNTASGELRGIFYDFSMNCEVDFRVEFENIEVND